MSEFSLRQLQYEQKEWVAHNFPGRERYYPLLGAVEELGELCHAHLKHLQNIRGMTDDVFLRSAFDAIGDAVIYLADYCSANGIDLQDAVEITWNKVKKRDWQINPKDTGND